jgi:hypothetical protein
MTEPIRMTIPLPTPSGNETLRMHWAKRARLADALGLMLIAEHRRTGASVATGRRKLAIERVGTKLLDQDNLVSGCKLLIDEIKRRNLIVDDSPAHVELVVTQRQIGKGERPHTVITIGDV